MKYVLKTSDENVVILPGARVTGDVSFGPDCSVWYNAVVRGDGNPITVGRDTNIQDGALLHGDKGPIAVGERVSVGHGAILHCCTVGDDCIIGMGAIVLDGAVVGNNCLVAAGAVVTGGARIPDGSLVMGCPAVVRRALTQEEKDENRRNALHYVELKEQHR